MNSADAKPVSKVSNRVRRIDLLLCSDGLKSTGAWTGGGPLLLTADLRVDIGNATPKDGKRPHLLLSFGLQKGSYHPYEITTSGGRRCDEQATAHNLSEVLPLNC